jgi:outer membrane lipoprotein LolB
MTNHPFIKQISSALILIYFLAGCANPPQPSISLHAPIHQLSLQQQDSWLIKGKLGFKSPEKKQSANLRWEQTQQQYQLNLTSIIGTSLLNMKGNEEGVTLTTDDETYQDSDPSYLIWRVTGWQVPVEKLRFWVKGQHQKKDTVLTSEHGWVSQLQPMCSNCKNWLINYDNSINNSQLLIRINKWELYE